MKVLHISTFSSGGAANAALRLHQALLEQGVESFFLFLLGNDINIPFCYRIQVKFNWYDKLLFKLKLKKHYWDVYHEMEPFTTSIDQPFTLSYSDFNILKSDQAYLFEQADIVHLHWVNYCIDSTSIELLSRSKKIVWTLHDMNPFTGGCHYAYACIKFTSQCQICPQLLAPINDVASHEELMLKMKNLGRTTLTIVPLNEWMCRLSKSSTLFRDFKHTIIPNCINTDLFKWLNKLPRKESLPKKYTIGYVASYHSKLKGIDIFLELVNAFSNNETIQWVYIGKEILGEFSNLVYRGLLKNEDELVSFYNEIDFLIVPSRGDNMPNVIIEALCCGTPVIASSVGGIPELITNENGILILDNDPICWIKEVDSILNGERDGFDNASISNTARERYKSTIQAKSMIELYENIE